VWLVGRLRPQAPQRRSRPKGRRRLNDKCSTRWSHNVFPDKTSKLGLLFASRWKLALCPDDKFLGNLVKLLIQVVLSWKANFKNVSVYDQFVSMENSRSDTPSSSSLWINIDDERIDCRDFTWHITLCLAQTFWLSDVMFSMIFSCTSCNKPHIDSP